MRFGLVLVLVQQATNMVYGPKIARLFMDGYYRGAIGLYIKSALITSGVSGFLVSLFLAGVEYYHLKDVVPVNLVHLNIVFVFLIFSFLLGPSENVNIFLGRKQPIFWSNALGAIALIGLLFVGAEFSVISFIVAAMSFLLVKKAVNTLSVFFMTRDSAV